MPRHSIRALICGVLLVPLAWIGIVLLAKLHGSGALIPLMVIWALVIAADAALAIWSAARARRCRVEQTPESTSGVK